MKYDTLVEVPNATQDGFIHKISRLSQKPKVTSVDVVRLSQWNT
jgi:hypothetical protein